MSEFYVKVEVVFKVSLKDLQQARPTVKELLRYTPVSEYKIISIWKDMPIPSVDRLAGYTIYNGRVR